jgi:hypothetical protein
VIIITDTTPTLVFRESLTSLLGSQLHSIAIEIYIHMRRHTELIPHTIIVCLYACMAHPGMLGTHGTITKKELFQA